MNKMPEEPNELKLARMAAPAGSTVGRLCAYLDALRSYCEQLRARDERDLAAKTAECDELRKDRDHHKGMRELGWSHMQCALCGAVQAGKYNKDLAETRAELELYVKFYEAVESCFQDTWQCRCGNSAPWWKETNAEFLTREIRQAIDAPEGT